MAHTAWEVYDPITGLTHQLSVNPQSFKATVHKGISGEKSSAGQRLLFEGRESPTTFSFNGVILDEDQMNTLKAFALNRNQLKMTDDMGSQFWFYITSFQPQRQLKRQVPWYHTYTMEAILLWWEA